MAIALTYLTEWLGIWILAFITLVQSKSSLVLQPELEICWFPDRSVMSC